MTLDDIRKRYEELPNLIEHQSSEQPCDEWFTFYDDILVDIRDGEGDPLEKIVYLIELMGL